MRSNRSSGHWVDRFQEGKAVKIGVPGVDRLDPVLPHEDSRVNIMQDVPAKMRHRLEHFGSDRWMALAGDQHIQTG